MLVVHCSPYLNAAPAPFNPVAGADTTVRSVYIEHGLAASSEAAASP
jgi:hypothetical protein